MATQDPYANAAAALGVTGDAAPAGAPAPSAPTPAPAAAPAPAAPAKAPADPYAAAAGQLGISTQPVADEPEAPGILHRLENAVAGPGTLLPMLNPVTAVKGYADALKDPVQFAKSIPGLFEESTALPLAKFEGAMTPEEQEAHPLITGVLERLSGMTSPQSAAILELTGGLGSLPGASGKVVPRLLSGAFSAAQISSLIKEVPAFRAAIANGDVEAAEKIAGHFTVDLAGALMGGQHSIVGENAKPIFPGMDEAIKDYVAQGASKLGVTADIAKNTLSEAAGKAKQSIKDKIANTQTGPEGLAAIQRAFPPSNSAPYEANDAQIAYNALAEHHATVEDLRTPEDVRDGLDAAIKDNEGKVKAAIAEIKDEPIRTNVMDRVEEALKSHPKNENNEFLNAGLAELKGYELDNPSVSEADRIRRILNSENQAVLKRNDYALDDARATDPGFVAREAAAAALRDGVYDTLDAHGKDEGVSARQLRQDEGSLIKFRTAVMQKLLNGEQMVRGTGNESVSRNIARAGIKYGTAAAGAAVGAVIPIPGSEVAGALTGREVGGALADKYAPTKDMTRNDLIESAFTKKARGADVTETPSEQQIKGKIRKPVEAAPKGQTEVPFGPPDLFGMAQGERTPMEFSDEELGQISKAVQSLHDVKNDPNATRAQKIEADRKLSQISPRFAAGAKAEAPEGMISAPSLMPDKFKAWYEDNYGKTVIPSETTTGKYDEAIKAAGAIPGGIQKGEPDYDLPEMVYFHDPITGSSLNAQTEGLTPEVVKQKIRESRMKYLNSRTPKMRAAEEAKK